MEEGLNACGQGLEEVQEGGQSGGNGDGHEDTAVIAEPPATKTKKDQGNRERVEEHQHRKGEINDSVQAKIGNAKGK